MLKSAIIYTTYKCNLNCDYCFILKTNEVMSQETLVKIFDWFKKNVDTSADNPHVSLLGGEIFLYPDLIYKLADLMQNSRDKNKKFSLKAIPTNGTLLDRTIIQTLSKKGVEVAFSLDGYSYSSNKCRFKDKNIYLNVLGNIECYRQLIGLPQIKMTTHPQRAKFMYKDICSFLERGFTNIQLSPAFGARWHDTQTKEFFDNFYKVIKLHKALKQQKKSLCIDPIDEYIEKVSKNKWDISNCGLGQEIVFTPSGDAYACTLVVNLNNEQIKKDFYLGNIHKNNIDLKKMFKLKNYRMCKDLQINCRYCFPDLTCRKLCATLDFKAGARFENKYIGNLSSLEPFMFQATYQAYFNNYLQ